MSPYFFCNAPTLRPHDAVLSETEGIDRSGAPCALTDLAGKLESIALERNGDIETPTALGKKALRGTGELADFHQHGPVLHRLLALSGKRRVNPGRFAV